MGYWGKAAIIDRQSLVFVVSKLLLSLSTLRSMRRALEEKDVLSQQAPWRTHDSFQWRK